MALITLLRRWGGAQDSSHRHGAGRAGTLRRRAVLRRQHDHPGDLGAVRGRGHQGHPAGVGRVDRADHRGHHRGAVRRAAPRHSRRRAPVRAGDDRLVHRDRRLRCEWHHRPSGNPQGALAGICADVHGRALRDCVLFAGRGRARGHRRGSAVCRHGPLRPAGDRPGLAVPRPAGVCSQLSRPGGAAARRRGRGERPVFSAHPGLGTSADGAAGDRRNGDRISGGDHRGLFGGVAGRSARLSAETADNAHLGVDDRPDLRAVDQRCADGVGAHPGVRVPQLGGAGVCVRHGGGRHDHHHHAAVLLHRPHEVGDAAVAGRDRRRRSVAGRSDVPGSEHDQAGPRGMAAAADRRDRVHRDDHLAART